MIKVSAAIIVNNNKILIAKRKNDQYFKDKWEFPGGKIEKGETPEECLEREVKEELDIVIKVGPFFMENIYQYPDKKVHLLTYFASLESGTLKANEHEDFRWVSFSELDTFDFLEADKPIISRLKCGLENYFEEKK